MTNQTLRPESVQKDVYTVLVVDDHPLFRRGVRELLTLEPSIQVVGEAGSREEAIELVRRYEPDLTILDLNIKGSSGVEILTLLKEEDPSRRIVILTVSDSGDDLFACIRAGADGYFLKDMEPERFLQSLKEALEGRLVVDNTMTRYLTDIIRQKASRPAKEKLHLTEREEEVLSLIELGYSNKLIAKRLKITAGTVKGHVKHLLKKLGFKSRVEAAVWASQRRSESGR